jgi:hypothetical protein
VLRRIPPKIPKGPRLPVLRSSLLRRVDKAVGLHIMRCGIGYRPQNMHGHTDQLGCQVIFNQSSHTVSFWYRIEPAPFGSPAILQLDR